MNHRVFLSSISLTIDEVTCLSTETVMTIVEQLKLQADSHWYTDANISLERGEQIVAIGEATDNKWIIAFGNMVCGDAHEKLGRSSYALAWELLENAARKFWSLDDKISWARTWISRLAICIDLQRLPETLNNSIRAHQILTHADEKVLLFRLNQALGIINDKRGKFQDALTWYEQAAGLLEYLPEENESEIGNYFLNSGLCHHLLGDYDEARHRYLEASRIYKKHDKLRGLAMADLNIATVDQQQGNYRQALERYHKLDRDKSLNPNHHANMKRAMVTCYLNLNCTRDAHNAAVDAIEFYEVNDLSYEQAITLLDLAKATSYLDIIDAPLQESLNLLDKAEGLFKLCFQNQNNTTSDDLNHWLAMVSLYRASIALRFGDVVTALPHSQTALQRLEVSQRRYQYANALMIYINILLTLKQPEVVKPLIEELHTIAETMHYPLLRYYAFLLWGKFYEGTRHFTLAIENYRNAVTVIDHIQKDLTVALRPTFLEDKDEAVHLLINLYIKDKHYDHAFHMLERLKSQVVLNYLVQQQTFPMLFQDNVSDENIQNFEARRKKLHKLSQAIGTDAYDSEEYRQCEQELLMLTRLLNPISKLSFHKQETIVPTPEIIQPFLEDTLLIEYYIQGDQISAFILTKETIEYQKLPQSSAKVEKAVRALQRYNRRRLRLPIEQEYDNLNQGTHQQLRDLHDILIAPLGSIITSFADKRLVIVPFNWLHFVPFHLLFHNGRYFIETHEIIIQPAASLLTTSPPIRNGSVLALAHKGDPPRVLEKAEREAEMVYGILGGKWHPNATREQLQAPPVTVLHIASHGKYDQQPELSYINLCDGPLHTAELLQYDLSYELITLSACETGQMKPSGGDELIGLGRSFLYAGAGALITSLWKVHDDFAIQFMECLYHHLKDGLSKSGAVRQTYKDMIHQYGHKHPALWGAFQFSGNPKPLSNINQDIL